jgi:MoaA/NifB/PqqE/SkfB family radical SAM enzyme
MDAATLDRIVSEAAGLGISVIVISGGEPLIRKDEILALAKKFPEILFPVFTNGFAIDDGFARGCAERNNVVPIISVEGFREETDRRRGTGVYDRVMNACGRLRENRVFFGCAVTVTSQNLGVAVSGRFVKEMTGTGTRTVVYVEYVPVEAGTDYLVLSPTQQKDLHAAINRLNTDHPALFFGFPGDEAMYGGCLAAGRGFVHINPSGSLEACPAAPFSDTNLTRVPLREALKSPLLQELRSHHGILTESAGGCALWKNREWIKGTLLKQSDCSGK